MAKRPIPHPTLSTARLRLRQFRADDADEMHMCFADPEAMRFWNQPVYTKRVETERSVRNFIDCTPSYYRFWAVADGANDRCLGLVNYHDGHIRSRRASIGYMINPLGIGRVWPQRQLRPCLTSVLPNLACTAFKPLSIRTTAPRSGWLRNWASAAKGCCEIICVWVMFGATICSTPSFLPSGAIDDVRRVMPKIG